VWQMTIGDAENAKPEKTGPENAAPYSNGGKCETGKCGKRHCMEHRVLLMSAKSCRMRPLSRFKRG
jgi:hypothetical protein